MPGTSLRSDPEEALSELRSGHRRFLQRLAGAGTPPPLNLPREHRPLAAVVGCADARVDPETIFDQPLGSLFVVRSAGQMLGTEGVGSLEFAVAELGVPLVLVLGHTQCGALQAALSRPEQLPAQLDLVVQRLRSGLPPGFEDADAAAAPQVRRVLRDLNAASALLSAEADAGRLLLAGAVYDVASGRLDWVEFSP